MWLNTDERAILLVCGINREISSSLPALSEQPEVCPRGKKGTWNISNRPVTKVGKEVIEDWYRQEGVRGEEKRQKHAVWLSLALESRLIDDILGE
jgi:hypothetical protein